MRGSHFTLDVGVRISSWEYLVSYLTRAKKVHADALPLALRLWPWLRAGAGGTGHNTCLRMGICQGASVLYVTLLRPFDKPLRSCSGFDLRQDVLLKGVLAGRWH